MERRHETDRVRVEDSLAPQPERNGGLPPIRSHDSGKRAAIARRQAKTLRFHGDNVGFGGWTNETEGYAFRNRDDEFGAGGVYREPPPLDVTRLPLTLVLRAMDGG